MEIKTSTTKNGRINVYADGEYLFTVPAFVWYASPLCGESEADGDALEELKAQGEARDAYDKALRLLGMRAHGEKELRIKLRQRYSPDAVDDAVTKLTENGLLDDAAFAESLAEELYRRKRYAPDRIYTELLKKGVDGETAKNALNSIDIDRKQGIIDIITKMRLSETLTRREKDRLLRRLLQAGYSMREIREVVEFNAEPEEIE